jgi:hypothetical protein
MKLQLWMTDEYGQGSIIETSENIDYLAKRAREEVHQRNVGNALAASEKQRAWESMFIELYDPDNDELIEDAVYGGTATTGYPCVVKTSGDDAGIYRLSECHVNPRIYLGELDRKQWYLTDERNVEYITDVNNNDLSDKILFYIRPVRQPKV